MYSSKYPKRRARDSRRLALVSLPLVTAALLALSASAASGDSDGGGLSEIEWQRGPAKGRLGSIATLDIRAGDAFADAKGAKKFLELTENIPTGGELGVLVHPVAEGSPWFVIFSFDPVGYVKDDDRDSLDAEKLLATIRKGTEKANKARKEKGWSTLDIVGWKQAPFYDADTHNLTWAILGRGDDGDVVNYETRLLGRRGVMQVNLVIEPADLDSQLPTFKSALGGFTFTGGNRYAEFRKGDKIASYGLTALIAGGAAAVATKTGLLAKLWKVLVAGVVGIGAWLRRLFSRSGASNSQEPKTPTAGT